MSFARPVYALARTRVSVRVPATAARQFSLDRPTFKARGAQDHATDKAKDPIHKDKDIQSSAVRGGQQNKGDAQSQPASQGENEPFDAARQGNTGGEFKTASAAGTGPFKDQVGGQGAGGVKEGKKENAPDESLTDKAKNALSGKRSFHSSARVNVEPASDAGSKSREPKNTVEKQGEQSGHLKHKSSPEKPDQGKGNAAPEPHLPSQQGAQQKRGYATKPPGGYSKTFTPEAAKAGHDVPPEALPASLKSAYADEATPKPDENAVPSHESGYASTSMDPPHKVLTQQAKDGTLADRNPPPEPSMGEMGNKEAWKHRK